MGLCVDQNLETSKYPILTKRPEYKASSAVTWFQAASRSRLLKELRHSVLLGRQCCGQQVVGWKDAQWVELMEQLLQAASNLRLRPEI